MKKKSKIISVVLIIIVAVITLIALSPAGALLYLYIAPNFLNEIGTISGPELEIITIGDTTYELAYSNGYSQKDRDRLLGKVIGHNGDVVCQVYSIKGTDEYIYRLWDWEGEFYKKK